MSDQITKTKNSWVALALQPTTIGCLLTLVGLATMYWVPETSHLLKFLKELGTVFTHTGIIVALLDQLTHRHFNKTITSGVKQIKETGFDKLLSEGVIPQLHVELKQLLYSRPVYIDEDREVRLTITKLSASTYRIAITDRMRLACHNVNSRGSHQEVKLSPAVSNHSHVQSEFTSAVIRKNGKARVIYPEEWKFSVFSRSCFTDTLDFSDSKKVLLTLCSSIDVEVRGAILFQFSDTTLSPAVFTVEHNDDVPVRAIGSRDGLIEYQGRSGIESSWALQRPAFLSDSIVFSLSPYPGDYAKQPSENLTTEERVFDVEIVEESPTEHSEDNVQ